MSKPAFEKKSNTPLESQVSVWFFRKAICRGLAKNDSKFTMLFALANVFQIDRMI